MEPSLVLFNNYQKVKGDIKNLTILGKIQPGHTIEVDTLTPDQEEGEIRISYGTFIRYINQTFFNTLAEGESTVKWVNRFIDKIKLDVENLKGSLQIRQDDNSFFKKRIVQLSESAKTAAEGLTHLAATYSNDQALKEQIDETSIYLKDVLRPYLLTTLDEL